MTITSPVGSAYWVDEKRLGSTDEFTLYECVLSDKTPAILKIATSVGTNGLLDREAYVLDVMRECAEELEKDYEIETGGKNFPLNNHFFFPNLVESFIAQDQGNRRVSILSFPNISKKLSDLVPLSYLTHDHLCVDPRTSAWILGKLLKLLVFTHQQGITSTITGENILINKEGHFVSLFDWTASTISNGEISKDIAGKEIACITKEVLRILGASEDGALPADEQLVDSRYEDFLKQLASGGEDDALVAHQKFYELIRSLWPRAYHPFSTKNL